MLAMVGCLLTTACIGPRVVTNTQLARPVPVDTTAFVSTVAGPPVQPVFPLLDAAAFNGKTNKLADRILAAQAEAVEVFRDTLLTALRAQLPATVVTAEAIHDDASAARLRGGGEVSTKREHFPVAHLANGDLLLTDLAAEHVPNRLFATSPALRAKVAAAAEASGAEVVLVAHANLAVVSAGALGVFGTARMEARLFLFDRKGIERAEVFAQSELESIPGNRLEDYTRIVGTLSSLADDLAAELAKLLR